MGSNHQTTNSESTIFLANIYYDFFFDWQNEKNKMFWTNKKLFSCSTGQTEKNSRKNWGKQNSLFGVMIPLAH